MGNELDVHIPKNGFEGFLKSLDELGISIENTAMLQQLFSMYQKYGFSVEDCVELAFVRLRANRVEILCPARYQGGARWKTCNTRFSTPSNTSRSTRSRSGNATKRERHMPTPGPSTDSMTLPGACLTRMARPHGTAATFVDALTDAIFYLETIICSQPGDRIEQQTKHTPIPTQGTNQSSSTLTADPWKRAYLLADMHGDLAQMNTIVQQTPGKDAAWRQAARRDNILLAACQAFDDHDLPRLEQFLLDARDDHAFYPVLLQTVLLYALEEAHHLNHDA